ncbi:MAG: hypothetical protein WD509_03060 [Candidatus Paceibacterota bacterium]
MDTGNLGESILTTWCHQVDLIPNKVTIDKDGWDFLVALPSTYSNDIKSLDKDDSHDRILIQVKTTAKEKGNRNIKLSNLKKLSDAPIPAFYLLIQVDENSEPVKAHLFHVWEEIIANIQKKIRTLPKDKWDQLNKYKLALPWKTAQEIKDLHGSELKQKILSNLTKTKKNYSEKKYSLREKVGYDKETGKINFQGRLPDKYKDDTESFMVDLYLGEIDKVEVFDWEVTDKRFGDEIVIDKQVGGHFRLTNIEPEGPATIKFMTADHRVSVEISTEYFIPRGIGQLVKDEKKWKILYKASFIKFFIYPEGKKFNFLFETPDFRKRTKLSEIIDITNLMLFLRGLKGKEKVNFEISHKGNLFWGGNLCFDQYKDELSVEYFKSIKCSNRLLNFLDIKNDLYIKPLELKAQLGMLNYINELLAPKPLDMKLEFWVIADLKNYNKTICLMPISVRIGDYVILIEVKVEGDPEKTGEIKGENIFYGLKSNNVRIEQHRVIKREKADLKKTYNEMKEKSLKKYNVSDDVMVIHHDPDTENES